MSRCKSVCASALLGWVFYTLNSVSVAYSVDQVWLRHRFQGLSTWLVIHFLLKGGQGGLAPPQQVNTLKNSNPLSALDPRHVFLPPNHRWGEHFERRSGHGCVCVCVAIWYNFTAQRALGLTWVLAEGKYLKICLFPPITPPTTLLPHLHTDQHDEIELTYPEAHNACGLMQPCHREATSDMAAGH